MIWKNAHDTVLREKSRIQKIYMAYKCYIEKMLLSRFSLVRLCDPIDGSPPGSPFPGILQARTLEWVAISFSNA